MLRKSSLKLTALRRSTTALMMRRPGMSTNWLSNNGTSSLGASYGGSLSSCRGSLLNGSPSLSLTSGGQRFIVFDTHETPNPNCLRFYSMDVSFLPPGSTMDFPNEGHSYKSPLAEMLFGLDGVEGVYFADEYITVTKAEHLEWDDLKMMVKEAIKQFIDSEVNILSEQGEDEVSRGHDDTEPKPYDSDVVLAVKELLATRIRPMVAADGGNVRYVGMFEGSVYVMLEGACKSCPSSGNTLKNGIERMLMHWVPEVTEVEEVHQEFAEQFAAEEAERRKKAEEESPDAAKKAEQESGSAAEDATPKTAA